MKDSGEFQEVESNYSGRLSYVSSQLAMIPSARSMLSRDKRLPLDTWNTSGLQENVLGKPFLQMIHPEIVFKEFTPCATQIERGPVPQAIGTRTSFARDDEQNWSTIPMPTFARRPSTMSSFILV